MTEFINSVDLSGHTRRGDPRPVKLTRGGNGQVLITIQTGKEKREVDVVIRVQELADAAKKLGASKMPTNRKFCPQTVRIFGGSSCQKPLGADI
jgi:hypothetical protein